MRTQTILFLALLSAAASAETLRVPLDYSNPKLGSGSIYYELGAPLDRHKPFLFIIADGQQFYVHKGRLKIIQKDFGTAFNVLGIVGRADAPDMVKAVTNKNGSVDWQKAWRYYRSDQWVEDIERVRRKVAGANGKILLYGASGGAMMSHQYMAKYGQHVSRRLTPAALMPFIEEELNISPPKLWPQLSPDLRQEMTQILQAHKADRPVIATVFQRQHFFVTAQELPEARAELIHALARGDEERLKRARTEYQVDGIYELCRSAIGIPITVREYEFLAGANRLAPPPVVEFDPELESEYDIALPVIELRRQGKVGLPTFDFRHLHKLDADVLIIAGVHDEAVDYRSSISLAARYPNGHVLIFNDNHMFSNLTQANLRSRLHVAFLLYGTNSPQFKAVLAATKKMIWNENG